MRVITRGIPDFSYVDIQEVDNIGAFLAAHTLKVRRAMDVRAEYFRRDTNQRVFLYIEGIEENRTALQNLCLLPGTGPMRTMYITPSTLHAGRLGGAGTGSSHRLEAGNRYWYLVEPRLDPRYQALYDQLRAQEREAARLAQIEQDKEDALQEEVNDLVSNLGYTEALRRLKGE